MFCFVNHCAPFYVFFIIIPECIVLLNTLILNNIPKDEDGEETTEEDNQQVVAEAMVELSSTGVNKLDQQQQQGFHIQILTTIIYNKETFILINSKLLFQNFYSIINWNIFLVFCLLYCLFVCLSLSYIFNILSIEIHLQIVQIDLRISVLIYAFLFQMTPLIPRISWACHKFRLP